MELWKFLEGPKRNISRFWRHFWLLTLKSYVKKKSKIKSDVRNAGCCGYFVRGFQKIRRFYGVKVRKFPYKSWPIFAIWPEQRKRCPTFDLSKLFSLKSVFIFNSVSAIKSVSSHQLRLRRPLTQPNVSNSFPPLTQIRPRWTPSGFSRGLRPRRNAAQIFGASKLREIFCSEAT